MLRLLCLSCLWCWVSAAASAPAFCLRPAPEHRCRDRSRTRIAPSRTGRRRDGTEPAFDAASPPVRAPGGTRLEYVKLNNQFVVPIVRDGVGPVAGRHVADARGRRRPEQRAVFDREPRLRDAFLQVLFAHANAGGFDGSLHRGAPRWTRCARRCARPAQRILGADGARRPDRRHHPAGRLTDRRHAAASGPPSTPFGASLPVKPRSSATLPTDGRARGRLGDLQLGLRRGQLGQRGRPGGRRSLRSRLRAAISAACDRVGWHRPAATRGRASASAADLGPRSRQPACARAAGAPSQARPSIAPASAATAAACRARSGASSARLARALRASARQSGSRRRRRGNARAGSAAPISTMACRLRARRRVAVNRDAGLGRDLADAARDLVDALGDADRHAAAAPGPSAARRRSGSGSPRPHRPRAHRPASGSSRCRAALARRCCFMCGSPSEYFVSSISLLAGTCGCSG